MRLLDLDENAKDYKHMARWHFKISICIDGIDRPLVMISLSRSDGSLTYETHCAWHIRVVTLNTPQCYVVFARDT